MESRPGLPASSSSKPMAACGKKNPGREDPGMNAFRFRQATEFRSSRQKTSVNRATVSMIPMTMR